MCACVPISDGWQLRRVRKTNKKKKRGRRTPHATEDRHNGVYAVPLVPLRCYYYCCSTHEVSPGCAEKGDIYFREEHQGKRRRACENDDVVSTYVEPPWVWLPSLAPSSFNKERSPLAPQVLRTHSITGQCSNQYQNIVRKQRGVPGF